MAYNWNTKYKPNYKAGYPLPGQRLMTLPAQSQHASVISTQPKPPSNTRDVWMGVPAGGHVQSCPSGLEYLTMIDQLLVKQKVGLSEVFGSYESNNAFTIKNTLGQHVYWAIEDTDYCTQNCCGSARPFDMKIVDSYKSEVIHLSRPLACSMSCCFPCCLQSIDVTAYGQVYGCVEQEWAFFVPKFAVKNENRETILRIEGPACTFSCGGDVDFEILNLDGVRVGRISKQWSGLAREMFTSSDFFGIKFPMELDVKMKAVLLGACFLIDAMFFGRQ